MRNTGSVNVTKPTDREVVMTRVIDAPRALVFDAWTNPERLPHWMLGKEARDAAVGTGMPEGASASFDRLAELLASEEAERAKRRARGA